jgi:hypothetical protein
MNASPLRFEVYPAPGYCGDGKEFVIKNQVHGLVQEATDPSTGELSRSGMSLLSACMEMLSVQGPSGVG